MHSQRFNYLFTFLMVLAFAFAFVLPPGVTDRVRVQVAAVFSPVSWPARAMAESALSRFREADPRSNQTLVEQNEWLQVEVTRLQLSVDRLEKLNNERAQMGPLKDMCTRVTVAGTDSGGRDSLILNASTLLQPLRSDEAALYFGGLAGRVVAGLGGARVRLVTDRGFYVTGSFIRTTASPPGGFTNERIVSPVPGLRGIGHGEMSITNLSGADVVSSGLAIGDWVLLDDHDWPTAIQGVKIGHVTAINIRSERDFADIHVAPETDLLRLNDVMVLTSPGAAAAEPSRGGG